MKDTHSMSNYHAKVVDQLEAVNAYVIALREAYKDPHHSRAHVADLHAEIGRTLKVAQVNALLAIADQLERRPR